MRMYWFPVDDDLAAAVHRLPAEKILTTLDDAVGKRVFEVDKAWHGLHWILSGTTSDPGGPLGPVVLGGQPFASELAWGEPPRWMPPQEVAVLAGRLQRITRRDVVAGIDQEAMGEARLYPSVIWRRGPLEVLALEQGQAFETVRDGYVSAASRGDGMVVALL